MGLWLKQDDGTLVEVSGGSGGSGVEGGTGADGKGWTGGTYDAATGVVTFTSDDGLEFTTGDLRGANGIDGLDGNMWHVGSGAPDPTLGEPGDYYLDGTDGWVYVKRTASSWTNLYVNLTGPPGDGGGSHDHDYLPLAGGTLTGNLQVDGTIKMGDNILLYRNGDIGYRGKINGVSMFDFYEKDYQNLIYRSLRVRAHGGEAGDLQVDGSATVGGKAVSVYGHTHNYAAPHDHPYAASSHTHSYSPTSHTHDKVAGYGVSGGTVPPSGAQVVRSHTNGYTYLGWLNTVSGSTTNEPTRIYTNSGGTDSFLRYMTPANFRAKVTDGSYAPKSHSHSYLLLTGGTLTGALNVQGGNAVLNLRNSAATSRPYMTFYYNGTRAGYIGYPSAASGGSTSLHADNNTLLLNGAKVQVSPDLQVDGKTKAQNGTAALPAYSFTSDTNTGMWRPSSDALELVVGGERAVYFGKSTNSSGHGVFMPLLNSRPAPPASYPAVMVMDNSQGGMMMRATSARRHLKNVEAVNRAATNSVYDLKPVWYRSKTDVAQDGHSHYGFVADDVAAIDPRLVTYSTDDEGQQQPETVNDHAVMALLVSAVKSQRETIADLTARIEALEA